MYSCKVPKKNAADGIELSTILNKKMNKGDEDRQKERMIHLTTAKQTTVVENFI